MGANQITIPAVTYAGEGSVETLREIIQKEHAKSILVFTDKGIRSFGLSTRVEEICAEEGTLKVVDDLTAEPAVADIERVLREVEGDHPDLIVGLGGGSVMDVAKLASILIGAPYSLRDLLVDAGMAQKQVKSVMIPTTCGTGSEATCNAIVAIPEEESKKGIVNNCMISDYVILDVQMIAKLPPKIIAATGVDALAHCVECFTSKKATMLSDTYAKEGARKILHNIRRAFSAADDLAAKQEMLLGAYYGGMPSRAPARRQSTRSPTRSAASIISHTAYRTPSSLHTSWSSTRMRVQSVSRSSPMLFSRNSPQSVRRRRRLTSSRRSRRSYVTHRSRPVLRSSACSRKISTSS